MSTINKEQKVIDLDLSPIQKTKIRVNGDQNNVIELNLSDLNVVTRLNDAYKRLKDLSSQVASLAADPGEGETAMDKLASKLTKLDRQMRDEIDYIFDSKVSDACVPNGNMYDPHDGEFTFEHVIEALAKLYSGNLSKEFKDMRERINKKTSKYTSQKK